MEKTRILSISLGLIVLFFFSCKKENESNLEFGDIQVGFEADSVYQASTDGFLTLDLAGNESSMQHKVILFADTSQNPTTEICTLYNREIATFPIKKNYFWKTDLIGDGLTLKISWTPLIK